MGIGTSIEQNFDVMLLHFGSIVILRLAPWGENLRGLATSDEPGVLRSEI